jgi:hypothetical protein
LSRQSRRSPNRISCYTASRSPLAISLSSRATDQQLFSRLQSYIGIRTKHLARLHPRPGHRYVHVSANLRSARSVFRTFPSRPSTPVLAISPRHLAKAPRPLASRVPIHSHPFVRLSPRHRSLFAASLGPWQSFPPERAVVKPPRLSRPASSFISHVPFTDPPSLRSARSFPFPSAPCTPRVSLAPLLGTLPPPCTTPAPPFTRPRPRPSRGPIRTPHNPFTHSLDR